MTKRQEPSQSIFGLSKTLFVMVLILGVIWCTACVLGYVNPLIAVGSIVTFGVVVFVTTFVKAC